MTAALLEVRDVTVRFGGLTAVDSVSFSVQPGEICALIGPNGAGKSTLFNAIAGNVKTTGGEVRFGGRDIGGLTPHEIAALGIRRTFQNGGLFGHLTVLENVLVGLHTTIPSGFLGLLLGQRGSSRSELDATKRGLEKLALMDAAHLAAQRADALSGGQQRIVELVRALATDPPLLLLDEPAVGLSPPMRERLGGNIRRLAKEHGIAIVLVEHAIELVMKLSDRVIVLNYGKIVADAPPEEVRANRNVLEAYLGHA
jgi:branched-chain amino acid transport system ATP-binding protein